MEPLPFERRRRATPVAMDDHARDNLRFIRETMERASSFTAVPGWGGVAMGITAIGAAAIAWRRADALAWLITWTIEAGIALSIATYTTLTKSRRVNLAILAGPGRKFVLSFAPPIIAGGLLTFAFYGSGKVSELPGVWLLLYGAAVVTGGAFSVRVVPVMGLALMALGGCALFAPASWGDFFMAGGFGVVQIAFGIWIARSYGG